MGRKWLYRVVRENMLGFHALAVGVLIEASCTASWSKFMGFAIGYFGASGFYGGVSGSWNGAYMYLDVRIGDYIDFCSLVVGWHQLHSFKEGRKFAIGCIHFTEECPSGKNFWCIGLMYCTKRRCNFPACWLWVT